MVEALPPGVPTHKGYVLALRWFLIINVLFLCYGISIILMGHFIVGLDEKIEKTLFLYSDYTKAPLFMISSSALILSMNGLLGIVSTYYETPLFDSYSGFMLAALSLNLLASGTGASIRTRIIKSVYEGVFRAEVLHMAVTNHTLDNHICNNTHMWDRIQTDLECCGLSDPRDWILSPLNALPLSCCDTKQFPNQCKATIGLDNKLGKNMTEIRKDIYPLLKRIGCIRKFQDLTAKRKVFWTGVPLFIALFETFLFAFASYIADTLRAYGDYAEEEAEKHNVGNPKLIKLKSKQKKYKVIPESEIVSVGSTVET